MEQSIESTLASKQWPASRSHPNQPEHPARVAWSCAAALPRCLLYRSYVHANIPRHENTQDRLSATPSRSPRQDARKPRKPLGTAPHRNDSTRLDVASQSRSSAVPVPKLSLPPPTSPLGARSARTPRTPRTPYASRICTLIAPWDGSDATWNASTARSRGNRWVTRGLRLMSPPETRRMALGYCGGQRGRGGGGARHRARRRDSSQQELNEAWRRGATLEGPTSVQVKVPAAWRAAAKTQAKAKTAPKVDKTRDTHLVVVPVLELQVDLVGGEVSEGVLRE